MPVSADRTVFHGPHACAKSRESRRQRATSHERQTVCWRETDSNHQSRARRTAVSSREGGIFRQREIERRRDEPLSNLDRITRYQWFESGFLQRRVVQTSG